jgi:Putative  PD-(D/E)XK family member, (DUF4420)
MNDVAKAWEEIGATASPRSGWIARRLFPASPHGIQAAIRSDDGTLALLFEVNVRSLTAGKDRPDCVGFRLDVETVETGPNGRCRLCLVLKDPSYREIFATLAHDVAGCVAPAPTEAVAVRMLLSRLNTWQRFLERFGQRTLTIEEQAGLFAELTVLEQELLGALGPAAAVSAWRGPFREVHDFRTGQVSIEVKASLAAAAATFRVSSLEQLDPGNASCLLVRHVALAAGQGSGEALPVLIGRLRTTFRTQDPGAATEFDGCLMECGYLDDHATAYAGTGFIVRGSRWFEVREGFPRLMPGTVPAGIVAANYAVALAQCALFEIAADVAKQRISSRAQ